MNMHALKSGVSSLVVTLAMYLTGVALVHQVFSTALFPQIVLVSFFVPSILSAIVEVLQSVQTERLTLLHK